MGVAISLILISCAKHNKDDKEHNDLGSGDKSNLPVTLTSLIEHAEYCKAIYDSGGNQKDEVAFEVKQEGGITHPLLMLRAPIWLYHNGHPSNPTQYNNFPS